MSYERRTQVRFYLSFLLFILSAVAFLDRTNISIAGLQISQEYGLGNQHLGWIFSAFLVGYAVEVFFSFLDAFVHTFERVRNPKAVGASATA